MILQTDGAKKAQKKAAKEAGKGFKDSFKDTVCSVKSAGKTLLNATGINGKQKKEQAVDKIYGITRGIGTTIAHPIRSAKEIASGIKKKAKEKGESYVGGYILGEVTQTAATAGVAAAAGKGLKGAKAGKNAEKGTRPRNGISNSVKIEGRGTTGRITPNNLKEQMAMHQVQSDPLNNAFEIPIKLNDKRWKASDGWVKMQTIVETNDGSRITIHYMYNNRTGAFDDFKFK